MLNVIRDPSKVFTDFAVIPPSYIIFKDGGKIYAKNGKTGQIEFSGTNPTTVIQNVIDDLVAAGGGKILIKSGEYLLQSRVEITPSIPDIPTPVYASILLDSGIYLVGEGFTTILKVADELNASAISNKDHTNGNSKIVIENMTIDGNGANQTYTPRVDCIWFEKSSDIVIRNVYAKNAKHVGIILDGCTDFQILDSIIEGTVEDDGITMAFQCQRGVVKGNLVRDNNDAGIESDGNCSDIIIAENIVDGGYKTGNTSNRGIEIDYQSGYDPNQLIVVIGNVVRNCYGKGIVLVNNGAINCIVSENIIYECGEEGIAVFDPRNIVIGNFIKNVSKSDPGVYDGIFVNDDDIIIASNMIIDDQPSPTTGYAIRMESGRTNVMIIGNFSNRNFDSVTVLEGLIMGNKRSGETMFDQYTTRFRGDIYRDVGIPMYIDEIWVPGPIQVNQKFSTTSTSYVEICKQWIPFTAPLVTKDCVIFYSKTSNCHIRIYNETDGTTFFETTGTETDGNSATLTLPTANKRFRIEIKSSDGLDATLYGLTMYLR